MIANVLFNGLWQGAVLVAIAWFLTRLIPRSNAATRYAVWFLTLLALAVVPFSQPYRMRGHRSPASSNRIRG